LVVALIAATAGVWADTLTPPVELLEGLRSGQIKAEFRGAGDSGVTGIITRGEAGPSGVVVAPGTQFWAQGGGRQGLASISGSQADLSGERYAQVWVPTACTNFGLRAPSDKDVMVPSPAPSADMARLCRAATLAQPPRALVQVAVWAVANDLPLQRLATYLRGQAAASDGELTPRAILDGAANLLLAAGLDPAEYRMFR